MKTIIFASLCIRCHFTPGLRVEIEFSRDDDLQPLQEYVPHARRQGRCDGFYEVCKVIHAVEPRRNAQAMLLAGARWHRFRACNLI